MPNGALERGVRRAVAVLYGVCVVLLILLAVTIFFSVLARYVFRVSIPELTLLQRFSTVWLIFLGAAVAVHEDEHLAIDMLSPLMGDRGQRRRRVVIDIIVLIGTILFTVVGYNGFQAGITRTELLRLPMFDRARISLAYFNTAFLVGGVLMFLLHALAMLQRYNPGHSGDQTSSDSDRSGLAPCAPDGEADADTVVAGGLRQ